MLLWNRNCMHVVVLSHLCSHVHQQDKIHEFSITFFEEVKQASCKTVVNAVRSISNSSGAVEMTTGESTWAGMHTHKSNYSIKLQKKKETHATKDMKDSRKSLQQRSINQHSVGLLGTTRDVKVLSICRAYQIQIQIKIQILSSKLI